MNSPLQARQSPGQRLPVSIPRQVFPCAIASICATAANVCLYYFLKHVLGIEFVAPEAYPLPEVSPLPASDVVIFSLVFSGGASLIFLCIANTARRPAPIFIGISLVVLLLSLYLPLRIPTPPVPLATKLSLASMHVLGAGVLVPLLVIIGLPEIKE